MYSAGVIFKDYGRFKQMIRTSEIQQGPRGTNFSWYEHAAYSASWPASFWARKVLNDPYSPRPQKQWVGAVEMRLAHAPQTGITP